MTAISCFAQIQQGIEKKTRFTRLLALVLGVFNWKLKQETFNLSDVKYRVGFGPEDNHRQKKVKFNCSLSGQRKVTKWSMAILIQNIYKLTFRKKLFYANDNLDWFPHWCICHDPWVLTNKLSLGCLEKPKNESQFQKPSLRSHDRFNVYRSVLQRNVCKFNMHFWYCCRHERQDHA